MYATKADKIVFSGTLIALVVVGLWFQGCVTTKDAIKIPAAILTSAGIHEGAHIVEAEVEGNGIKFNGLKWDSERKSTGLQVAGFLGQGISTEVIRIATKPEDRGVYLKTVMLTNGVTQVVYSFLDMHDFDNGVDDWWRFVIFGHGAWTLYRLYHDIQSPFFVAPVNGGAVMGYSVNW